ADRKAQHFHVAQARREIVAVFVYDDEYAESHYERDHGVQDAHAARPIRSATAVPAARRAARSASITASRLAAPAAGRRASTCSITCGMAVYRSRPSRNASTATSLAALSIAGAVPSALSAA